MIETSLGHPRKSSAIFGKCSEIFGKSSEMPSPVCLDNKKNITRYEFYVLVARAISHSFAALTREMLFLPLEHKIHISPPCNILYVLWTLAEIQEYEIITKHMWTFNVVIFLILESYNRDKVGHFGQFDTEQDTLRKRVKFALKNSIYARHFSLYSQFMACSFSLCSPMKYTFSFQCAIWAES